MRKHVFTYVPVPDCSNPYEALRKGEEILERRTLSVTRKNDCLIGEGFENDPPADLVVWSGTDLWAFVNDSFLDGLRIDHVAIEYDNALLPHARKYDVDLRGERYCNGESRCHPNLGKDIYLMPLITCLPSKRLVTISLKIDGKYPDKALYVRALLHAVHTFEPMIIRTRTFKKFREAMRSGDYTAIRQAVREHYLALGQT